MNPYEAGGRSIRDDVLPGHQDERWTGPGLGLPIEFGGRPGECLSQDAHLRPPRGATLRPLDQREPVLLAVGDHPARGDFDEGLGLAAAETFYDAARVVGDRIRRVAELDRQALEHDKFSFNVHVILAGQIRGQGHDLYLIYPQGNPLRATEDSPFLQIGECKYGRPILDRGVRYDGTTLDDAARYALISLDSTMRSNVTVGPPIDLLVYSRDALRVTRHRRFLAKDPDLLAIQTHWEQALRKAVQELPPIQFAEPGWAGRPSDTPR